MTESQQPVAPAEALPPLNVLDPAFARDPYPAYAQLRELDPIHRANGFFAVSRYDDVVQVLKSPAVFSSAAMGAMTTNDGRPVRTIINTDPPEHTRIRNLINRAFTPRMVAELEPQMRQITRDLLDRVIPAGEMDLVADLAVPLPVTVIAAILGVDAERRDDFKRWSNAVVGAVGATSTEEQAHKQADRAEFWAFFAQTIEQRRAEQRDDLISSIIKAEGSDVQLDPEELIAFTMLLLIAGNETTTNLIGNAMLALTEHPDQLAAVAADPTRIPNMIEEALRYDSPVQFLFRMAKEDTVIGDRAVPANSIVVPMFASANRDDRRFPDAGRFDIKRNAQGHLAFGLGPHFCLGAPLARLEAKVAFEELFAGTSNVRRTSEDVARLGSMFLRGLTRLPIRFDPA